MHWNSSERPLAVAACTVVAAILLLAIPSRLGTIGQIALGVPLLLVFPGYVVYHILFASVGSRVDGESQSRAGIDHRSGPITLAIAIGFSVILVPIITRAVMATIGYSRPNVVVSVSVFVIVLAVVGAVRSRTRSPLSRRSSRASLRSVRQYLDKKTKFGLVTSVLLVVSVLFFLSTVGFALSGDPAGESYTEFYLLTENESDELVASDYPTTLDESASTELIAGVENNEHETVTYTVIVEVQRLADQSVVEQEEILRTQQTIEGGSTATIRHSIETEMTGSDLRIQYYLYRGEAPSDADVESAYRTVHLSVEGTD